MSDHTSSSKREVTGIPLNPAQTLVGGILLSIFVSWIIAIIGMTILIGMLHVDAKWGYIPFWLLFCFFSEELVRGGLGHTIAVQHNGIAKLFGMRIRKFRLTEGNHWLVPGVMSLEIVDMRIQETEPQNVEALSADGILIKAQVIFQIRVSDPYRYLSTEDPIASLYEISKAAVRNVFAAHDATEIIKAGVRKGLAEDIDAVASETAQDDYGIDVMKVHEPEIRLPVEVERALSNKLKEQADAEAEKIEMDNVRKRVKEMIDDGLDPKLAYENIQTERGKISGTRNIQRFEGLQDVASVVADAIKSLKGGK